MRVLIVKLSSFGDVIHTLPALTDLKAAHSDVEVDWLVEETFAGIVRRHPAVAEVHEVALRRLRWPPSRWPELLRRRNALKRTLRARDYDLVLDVQGLMKSALLARLAGKPIVGFDAASAREPSATRLYDRRLKLAGHQHVVEQIRRFFAEAIGYPLPSAAGAPGLAKPLRPQGVVPGLVLPRRYGLMVTAAGWPTKLWPEDRWRSLAERLNATGAVLVFPWGNPAERERAEKIAGGLAAIVLPRILSGDELAALVAHADFAVGLDTGIMHLAAAFDVPGVSLFGPTDPDYAGPHGRNQRFVRSDHPNAPCQRVRCTLEPGGRCCMSRISVEAVWSEVAAALADSRRPLA